MRKSLIILVMCIMTRPAINRCELALDGCRNLVQAEDTQITHLKGQVTQLEGELNKESNPLVPWWGWVIIGGVVGAVGAKEILR